MKLLQSEWWEQQVLHFQKKHSIKEKNKEFFLKKLFYFL